MNVLLGIGGSEDAFYALEYVIERSIEAGDELTVAIVDNPDVDETPAEIKPEVERLLAEHGVTADITLLEGHPGSALVDYAERGTFDELVLGGGRRSPMGKIQLGRISEFVILNAQLTVTLVR